MSEQTKKDRSPVYFAVADVLAVLAFVLIGKIAHNQTFSITDFLDTAWPFLAGLAISVWWFGPGIPSLTVGWRRLLVGAFGGWLSAVAVALVLRDIFSDRPVIVSFAVTSVIFGGVLLLVGRITVRLLERWRTPDDADKPKQ
jgi:hypothetical protein